jgi:hypothetical protein
MFGNNRYSFENVEPSRRFPRSILGVLGLVGYGLFALGHYSSRREDRLGPRLRSRRRRAMANLLNINTADREDLIRLCGSDRQLIDRIIENRPYATKVDLISRRILPDDMYEAIKYEIEVYPAA